MCKHVLNNLQIIVDTIYLVYYIQNDKYFRKIKPILKCTESKFSKLKVGLALCSRDDTFPFPVNLHNYEHAKICLPHLVRHSSDTDKSHLKCLACGMWSKVRMGYSH